MQNADDKTLPPGLFNGPRKTLEQQKQIIDTWYGAGTYDSMITTSDSEYTRSKAEYHVPHTQAAKNDGIYENQFRRQAL